MADKIATNTFDKGMNLDLNPLVAPNNVMSFCLNGTFLTFNGEDYTLQNDMGNAAINDSTGKVSLKEGYIPIGSCQLGGVLYIVSCNENGDGEIGSFPSIITNSIPTDLIFEEIDLEQLILVGPITSKIKYGQEKLDVVLTLGDTITIGTSSNKLLDWLIEKGYIKFTFYGGNTKLKQISDNSYQYDSDIPELLYVRYEWIDPLDFYFNWDVSSSGVALIYSGSKIESDENHSLKIEVTSPQVEKGLNIIQESTIEYSITYTIDGEKYIKTDIFKTENDGVVNPYFTLEFRYLWDEEENKLSRVIWKLYNPNGTPFEYDSETFEELEIGDHYLKWMGCIRPCIQNSCYNSYFDSYQNKDFINLSFDPQYHLVYQNKNINESQFFEQDLNNQISQLSESATIDFTLKRDSDYVFELIPTAYGEYIDFESNEITKSIHNETILPIIGKTESVYLPEAKTLNQFSKEYKENVMEGLFLLGAGCRNEKGHQDNHTVDMIFLSLDETEANGGQTIQTKIFNPISNIQFKYQLNTNQYQYMGDPMLDILNYIEFDKAEFTKVDSEIITGKIPSKSEFTESLINLVIINGQLNYLDGGRYYINYPFVNNNGDLDYKSQKFEINIISAEGEDLIIELSGFGTLSNGPIFEIESPIYLSLNTKYELPDPNNEIDNTSNPPMMKFHSHKQGDTVALFGDIENLWYKRSDSSFAVKYKDVQSAFDQFILSHMEDKFYCILGGIQHFVHPTWHLLEKYEDEGVNRDRLYDNKYFDNYKIEDGKWVKADQKDEATPFVYYSGSIAHKTGSNGKDGKDTTNNSSSGFLWPSSKAGYCIIIKISDEEYCISQPIPKNLFGYTEENKFVTEQKLDDIYSALNNLFKNKWCPTRTEDITYCKFTPQEFNELKSDINNICSINTNEFTIKHKDGSITTEQSLGARAKRHIMYPDKDTYTITLTSENYYFNAEERFTQIQDYFTEIYDEFEDGTKLVHLINKEGFSLLECFAYIQDEETNELEQIELDMSQAYYNKENKFILDSELEYDDEYEVLIPKKITDSENNFWTYIKPGDYNTQFLYSGILTTELPL